MLRVCIFYCVVNPTYLRSAEIAATGAPGDGAAN